MTKTKIALLSIVPLFCAGLAMAQAEPANSPMMMRHHPDVDPSGLERCKDVNVAYSLLIGEVSTRT